MAACETPTLKRLSDTDLTVAAPAEDVRGAKVVDRGRNEVGDVDDLIIDDREHKVRFLLVASGGVLGLGQTRFLIPMDAITATDGDAVRIDQAREHVAGAPAYDPDLTYDPMVLGGFLPSCS